MSQDASKPVESVVMRPGPGWSHMGGAVYQHATGIRIHVYGLCGFPGGHLSNGNQWPESQELDRLIRINGGNRKRGVMAWARNVCRSVSA